MIKHSKKEVLQLIKEKCSEQPIVVPLADTVREMMNLGKKENELYLLGAMGMPLSIATGIAMGLKRAYVDKNVVCIEGDGGLLMNVNSLLSVKYLGVKNLVVILLDNESYATTGEQPTYSSVVDLCSLAQELGFIGFTLIGLDELETTIENVKDGTAGPYFVHVKISNERSEVPVNFENPAILIDPFKKYLERLYCEVK